MAERMIPVRYGDVSASIALERTLGLVHRMVINQMRMVQFEWEDHVQRRLRRSTWIGFGLVCMLLAWVALLGAAVVALEGVLPLEGRLVLVSTSQLLLGVALIGWGRRLRRGEQ